MELNLQHGKEQPLDYNPIEYLVDIYRDLLAPNHEFNPEEYAAATNKKTSFIRKNMRIAQLLVDYLEFINKPLEFHVARKMSLDGPLREVDTILRSKKVDDSDEYEIKVYLFTNILVLRGDITRIVRNLRPIVEDKRKFEAVIEDSEEDLETIYDLLHQSQEDTSNPLKSEEDFIIPDIPIETQESIQSKTDNLIEEDKLKKAQNKPLELIKMSLARIEEVDSESIIRMSNANKEEFRQYLVSMEEAVTKLSDDLDAN